MAVTEKNILNRLYFVAGCMFLFGIAVMVKLVNIQFVQGDAYRAKASERIVKDFIIPANRGNLYSVNGNLLATSVPKYDIRFDALTPSSQRFEKHLKGLSDSLAVFFGKPSSYYRKKLRRARVNKNRYLLLARNLGYSEFQRFKTFPLLNVSPFRGGLIVEQKTKREHPMGAIAERTIGYERIDEKGHITRPGIDGAFGVRYLRGSNGKHAKQQIGKNQWKPIIDYNKVEPKDGLDVYTTIDVNIQDIAHHALLKQLELYKAEHGCVVVMEVKTGEIRAISNLGRTRRGTYYERLNYAVGESHEPGSTFKVMALMAALEDKVVDTATVIDTKNGRKRFYGRTISDSRAYGKISVARALELSSNIGLATIINDNYASKPQQFIDKIKSWGLSDTLDIPIIGEGKPVIPEPGDKIWSKNALPSLAYGYNLQLTPLHTLAFYNAIANNGQMLKPRFIKSVKAFDKEIEVFEKQVINEKICSDETLAEIKDILKHVVERGTGKKMYSKNFSMAGKTGTARTDYQNYHVWVNDKKYVSSFAGYFPTDTPKYSCIVVIHKPSTEVGFYGADVSGPVFKSIAQKIYTDTPMVDEIKSLEVQHLAAETQFKAYYKTAETYLTIMPDVTGLPTMDAVALLENMGLKVQIEGVGVVVKQSVPKGQKVKKNQKVDLKIS